MKQATLFRLMYWEWRRLRSERTNLLLLGIWCGLLAVAAWQGTRMTSERHSEIETARESAFASWDRGRPRPPPTETAASAGAQSQRRGGGGGFYSVVLSSSDQPVALQPTALGPTAAGAAELAPVIKHAGMLTRVHIPPDNLENPANRLAGRFDLLFVVSALLPLFVLAFAFDVLSRERELGIWPLVASQPIKPGWLVAGRLGLHFILLWLPLVIAATASVAAALPKEAAVLSTVPELTCWLGLVAAYLVFWQALAAWVNFLKLSAAGNALALCAAWLAFVLLVPALVQVAVQATTDRPDRQGLVLAERDADIVMHNRADEEREEEFYSRYGYERPIRQMGEIATFYVENIVPRAFGRDELTAPALDEVDRRREAQSRRTGQLAWASPALAFRRASEQLAGVSPVQQAVLMQEAREYQRKWRAQFGAAAAAGRSLTLEEYDGKPEVPLVRMAFAERLRAALPAVLAVLLASGGALSWAVATSKKRGAAI